MAPPKNEEANHVDGEPANHSGDTDDQLVAKDLMISYSHNDKELMVKIRGMQSFRYVLMQSVF